VITKAQKNASSGLYRDARLKVGQNNDPEIFKRTPGQPSKELIDWLNHLASKPPFCWTVKYKEHISTR
jgi:hypothetical protein